MNEFILNQLKSIPTIDLKYQDETTLIISKKNLNKEIKNNDLVLGKWYSLKFKSYITNPFPGFNLHQNWNNNIIPKYDEMNCQIMMIMGKMVKIHCITDKDENYVWEGWIPKSSIEQMEEI